MFTSIDGRKMPVYTLAFDFTWKVIKSVGGLEGGVDFGSLGL